MKNVLKPIQTFFRHYPVLPLLPLMIGLLWLLVECAPQGLRLWSKIYFARGGNLGPFSYKIGPSPLGKETRPSIPDAHILIVGDQLAEHLALFAPHLEAKLLKELTFPLKVGVMFGPQDGLHRTFHHLNRLKELPKVILYAGGNHETFEQKFRLEDQTKIFKNLAQYQDPVLATWIYAFPPLSSLIYESVTPLTLPSVPESQWSGKTLTEDQRFTLLQMSGLFYEIEMEKFIRWAHRKRIHIILMTIPIDLELPPRYSCTSPSDAHQELLDRLGLLHKRGDSKTPYRLLQDLLPKLPPHAGTYHLLGMVSKALGDFPGSKKALAYANAYDCAPERGSETYNAILRRVSKKFEVPLIDFQEIILQDFGKKNLFKDPTYPLDTYYEDLINRLVRPIGPIFQL